MSKLIRSNRNKKINRGHDIKPEKTFSLNDVDTTKDLQHVLAQNVDRVTFYANVRINNHIKNKIEALSTIGIAKSQKAALEVALDYYIESLPEEQKKKLEMVINTLEGRDVMQKSKNKN